MTCFFVAGMDMKLNSSVSSGHAQRRARIIREWLAVQRHYDFFMWLQGEIQFYLPHEIMLAAWGDFRSGHIRHDLISALVDVRTTRSSEKALSPLLQGLFNRWAELGEMPYGLHLGESGFLLGGRGLQCPLGMALQGMKSVLIHGVSDKRGSHDCLYLMFSSKIEIGVSSLKAIRILLPYLDTAFGRLEPIPCPNRIFAAENQLDSRLNAEETEIMSWTRTGKTIPEIATIVKTSTFTVKNHLENALRKANFQPFPPSPSNVDQVPPGPLESD